MTRRSLFRRGLVLAGATMLSAPLSSCARGQADPAGDPVDLYIAAEMAKRHIPGLALAVIQGGKPVRAQGYGLANLELDVPVTPDTVFALASLTKQFTATAIMLLVEQGLVGLDASIGDYVVPMPDKWRGITVRHLLTHTAGLARESMGFAALAIPGGPRANVSTTLMLDAAMQDPVSFAPGTSWQYSDVGYFLLGMIIEKASGRRYREFLSERLFQPLGMAATSVPDRSVIVKNRAAGYTVRDGQVAQIRRDTETELPSHVGVFSTVRDLTTWDGALAAGKVVKPSTLDLMWTPVTLNDGTSRPYGFGWEIKDLRGHRLITHAGSTGTEYTRLPDDGLTVIVLTNLGNRVGWPPVNSWGLTGGVAGLHIPGLLAT